MCMHLDSNGGHDKVQTPSGRYLHNREREVGAGGRVMVAVGRES